MEELKKAYEILGLQSDAGREEVENRYYLLLKKARARHSRGDQSGNADTAPDLAEINRAYKLIIGVETEKSGTVEKQGKWAHFFYYYKFHVIAAVLIILVIGYFTKQTIDKRNAEANLPPANLSVTVFGNFYFADMNVLEKNLLTFVPEWKRIQTDLAYVPPEIKSQQDMALQQKSVLKLMTEHSDLYILDETNFNALVKQQAFQKLDSLEGWTSLHVPKNKILAARTDKDTDEQPYGIDITGSPAFKGMDMTGERQILAVREAGEKWSNTRKLLEKLLRSLNK